MVELDIQNFILIDKHIFNIEHGFSCITGETGAGKSIIFESIRFLSGNRCKPSIIKGEAAYAEVTVSIMKNSISNLDDHLVENDLNSDSDEIVIRRRVNRDGKSSSYVNGTKVNLTQLNLVTSKIFTIVGQHDSYFLNEKQFQLNLVDEHHKNLDLINLVQESYRKVKFLEKKLEKSLSEQELIKSKKQLLSYQLSELKELNPSEDELSTLENEHKLLSNASELHEGYVEIYDILEGKHGINKSIQRLLNISNSFSDFDTFKNFNTIFQSVSIELNEAASDAQIEASSVEFDPERINYIDERMRFYYSLAKKLDCDAGQLFLKSSVLTKEIENLESYNTDEIVKELNEAKSEYFSFSSKLHKLRMESSKFLQDEVNTILQQLNMREGAFGIDLKDTQSININGVSSVVFTLKANAESQRDAISKVASGGEMSRITLAINSVMSLTSDKKTIYLFDEIDTGVSGITASYIGQLLKEMSSIMPVLSITHIPHIAGLASKHFHVVKSELDSRTVTEINLLNIHERTDILSSLLFGEAVNDEQKDLARKLIHA